MSIVEPGGAFPPGPYLALNRRLLKVLSGQPSPSLDVAALCIAHGVQVRGVIHVGAHEGTEIGTYEVLGAAATVFIEANPAVFARLHKAMAGRGDVVCINRAVSDRPGRVTMHLLSSDMSSSLLRLKEHASAYPGIAPAGTIDVDADTLDAIVRRLPLPGNAYNLLVIDVQGAEALVLRGGADTLACAEAVLVEVNFAELFENCAQIEDIEDILSTAGFRRVDMVCIDNAGWSDAFYVRERRTAG
jgi:FkbM family methyltransferase